MAVLAYKWGGISFDDKALIKILTLPSAAKDDAPITFHDGATNYQVPGSKVFIVGKISYGTTFLSVTGRVGEADAVDGALTKEILTGLGADLTGSFHFRDVIGVYAAGKYVTGESTSTSQTMLTGTTLFGVEIDA